MNELSLLGRLKNWIGVIKISISILAGVEALLVIIVGLVANRIDNVLTGHLYTNILIFLGILYFIITLIKIAYNTSFPSSIIGELNALKEVDILKKDLKRKDSINKYISETVKDLRKCVCEIPKLKEGDDWESISDAEFTSNFRALTRTFNNALNNILETTNAKYTTGLYVFDFRAFDSKPQAMSNAGIYICRDDHDLSEYEGWKTLMDTDGLKNLELQIQTNIRTSFNNGSFTSTIVNADNKRELSMICCNIISASNDKKQIGVFFIITDKIESMPSDIQDIFRIFANIFSHSIDLYDFKVLNRQLNHMGEAIIEDDSDDEAKEVEVVQSSS